MKRIYRYIYFKILKWEIVGDFPSTLNKYVVIAAPHTHWHDFPMGILLRGILGVRIHFVAKKELFKGPLNWYLRKVGGFPLDRTEGQNKVDAYASLFEREEEFRLAIAPEGTRKKVDKWKTGFYFIAKRAKVPIVMVAFDFENKQHKISDPFYPTDDIDKDFEYMYAFYKGVKGKIPRYS